MRYTTSHADPRPYSKVSETLGSRQGAAIRTPSRGVSLVDDLDRPAGVLTLVQQHLSEHSPAAIEHGGCHPCLGELQGAHVADDDTLIRIDDSTTELMAQILPLTTDAPMQAFGLPEVAASLQQAQFTSGIAIAADRRQALPIAGDRGVLDPQVDPDRLFRGGDRLGGDFYG